MKNPDPKHIDVQSLLDGELDPSEHARIERLIATDPDAALVRKSLTAVKSALAGGEPIYRVPDSREFYWSGIQRRIEAESARKDRTTVPTPTSGGWWRWLVPAAGMAAAIALYLKPAPSTAAVEEIQDELSSIVFRSDTDGVTFHWVQ